MSDSVPPVETAPTALAPAVLEAQASASTQPMEAVEPPTAPRSVNQFLSRYLGGAMLLAALGLHGLVLLLPMPAEKTDPPPTPPEETQVRITQLPTLDQPPGEKPAQAKSLDTPPPSQRVNPLAPSIPPVPSTLTTTQPAPALSPATVAPVEGSAPTSDTLGGNLWEDFPQYPGAQPGCYNLPSCLQTGKPLGEVATFFERELVAKKYAAELSIHEANRRVFQVSRNGLTQFLSLIYVEGQGTLYVLAEAPRTLADLAQAIEVPGAVYSVLSNLYAEEAGRDSFAQPDAFFTAQGLRSEVGIVQLVANEAYDTFFDTYFRNNLLNNGFESSTSPQPYGGGLLYTVTKDDLSLYICLLPTVDGTGTLIAILKSLPQ